MAVDVRDRVISDLEVTAAFHDAKRREESAQNHPLHARKHHAAYLRVQRARNAEHDDTTPPDAPWCGCSVCVSYLTRVRL